MLISRWETMKDTVLNNLKVVLYITAVKKNMSVSSKKCLLSWQFSFNFILKSAMNLRIFISHTGSYIHGIVTISTTFFKYISSNTWKR